LWRRGRRIQCRIDSPLGSHSRTRRVSLRLRSSSAFQDAAAQKKRFGGMAGKGIKTAVAQSACGVWGKERERYFT